MSATGLEPSISAVTTIIVSLLPFEKTLLDHIKETDKAIAQLIDDPGNPGAIAELFEAWGSAKSVRAKLSGLGEDLLEPEEGDLDSGPGFRPSPRRRERCYQAFLGALGNPSGLNKCRADNFDENNPTFKETLLRTLDIQEFIKAADHNVDVNKADDGYWKVMGAMMLRFPVEMKRWISGMRLSFELFPKRDGFEIWQVTRMYFNTFIHLTNLRPGPELLDIWGFQSDKSLRIWEEKQSNNRRQVKNLMRLLDVLKLNEHGSNSPSVPDEERTGAEKEIEELNFTVDDTVTPGQNERDGNITEDVVSKVEKSPHGMDKEEFLFKFFTFGHLNLHFKENLETISLEEVGSIVGNQKVGKWMRKLLKAQPPIQAVRLPNGGRGEWLQHLFFSEPLMFQHYCQTQKLPMATADDNARVALVTSLPDKLLELEPEKFFQKWNDCSLVLMGNEILLSQSILGWLFRNISLNLNEYAARQFLIRCVGPDYSSELRKALGQSYNIEYEAFLTFIPPEQLTSRSFLDNGGNGDVFSAEWARPASLEWGPPRQVQVAIKRIQRNNLSERWALEKFVREMRVVYLALSGSPNGCVEFYGITVLPTQEAEEDLHLVFELASEGNISTYLDAIGTGPDFAWEGIVDLFGSVAWALWDGLHQKGIVHGDLHEKNVLLTKRFYSADVMYPEEIKPVLIDFGRGSVTGGFGDLQDIEEENAAHSSSEGDTDAAPSSSETEASDDKILDHLEPSTIAKDVLAFGVLLWELTLRWTKLTKRTMIPAALVDLMAECMSSNESERPTMKDVEWTLEKMGDGLREDSESRVAFTSRRAAKMRLKPLWSISAKSVPKPSTQHYSRRLPAFSYPQIAEDEESSQEEEEEE